MNKHGFIIFGLLMLAAVTHAAVPKVRVEPAVYTVHSDLIHHTYVCAKGIAAGEIRNGIVHASLLRGNSRYLLIAFSEPSRSGMPIHVAAAMWSLISFGCISRLRFP